jgi:hypothetical protein
MSLNFCIKPHKATVTQVTSKMTPLVLVVAYLSLDIIHQTISFKIGAIGNFFILENILTA